MSEREIEGMMMSDRQPQDTMPMMNHGDHHQAHQQDMGPHSNHEMMMGKMYFHFGLNDLLLFPGFKLDSSWKLVSACAVIFLLALFLEALNYLRRIRCECELKPFSKIKSGEHHDHSGAGDQLTGGSCCCGGGAGTESDLGNTRQQQQPQARLCCSDDASGSGDCSIKHCEFGLFRHENKFYKLFQAALYFIQTGLALTLMLAAMTYNVCIIFAIVSGKR